MIRKRFEEKVIELVDFGIQNLWGHFKDIILMACDVVCGKKREKRRKGDIWWWNEKVMEAISRKKDAHKVMCWSSADENKIRYKSMKNQLEKVIIKAMTLKAVVVLTEFLGKF